MADEQTQLLELMATVVTITSHTAWHPDAGLPENPTLNLVARVGVHAIAMLGPSGAFTIGLEQTMWSQLVQRADDALRCGPVDNNGADTATGRPITTIELKVDRYHTQPQTVVELCTINHYGNDKDGPVAWRLLLDDLYRATEVRLGGPERKQLRFLRDCFREAHS